MIRNNCCRWLQPWRNKSDKNRPKYWPTVGIPPTPACKEWKKPKSMLILRWLATSTISELSGAHADRCPKGRRAPTACAGNWQTQVGRAIYAARKAIVEPVFGQIKQARGFRQFLLRGLTKVQGEWALVCMAHNILKLHRLVST